MLLLSFSCSVEPDSFATPRTAAWWAPLSMGSPGNSTRVSCHILLQAIFPSQGLNLSCLHCRWILYCWATGEAPISYVIITNSFYIFRLPSNTIFHTNISVLYQFHFPFPRSLPSFCSSMSWFFSVPGGQLLPWELPSPFTWAGLHFLDPVFFLFLRLLPCFAGAHLPAVS